MNDCKQLAEQDDLAAEMKSFYDDLDQDIASRQPVCTNRGKCCRFGEYGHKLYVTDLELAYFVRGNRQAWRRVNQDACPFQVEGNCTAREHRPIGCRVFFCDPQAESWQNTVYEERLERIKQIGAARGVAYNYREWLSALADVDLPDIQPDATPIDPKRLQVLQ